MRPKPETEGLSRFPAFKEVLEVARVVLVGHVAQLRFELVLDVLGASRIPRETACLVVAATPALARVADVVAGLLEQVRKDGPLGGKHPKVIDGLLELPGIASGQDAGPARRALGVGGEAVGEENALVGDAIEGRRADPVAAIRAGMGPAPVVGDREQDVRTLPLAYDGPTRPRPPAPWTSSFACESCPCRIAARQAA